VRSRTNEKEASALWIVVHDGVADEMELVQRVLVSLGAEGDDRGVVQIPRSGFATILVKRSRASNSPANESGMRTSTSFQAANP